MSALAAKATSLRTQVRVARDGYADALAAVAAGSDNQELVTAEARVNHLTALADQLARIRKQEQSAQTRATTGQAFAEQIGRERDDAVVAYVFRLLAAILVGYMAYKIKT
jgi:hypothetical protein